MKVRMNFLIFPRGQTGAAKQQLRTLSRPCFTIIVIFGEEDTKMRFCSSDFPGIFIDTAHPQDYLALDPPIHPEFIYHKNRQHSWNINLYVTRPLHMSIFPKRRWMCLKRTTGSYPVCSMQIVSICNM